MSRDDFNPTADEVPFDNEGTSFTADTTQEAIEEARDLAAGFPRSGLALVQNGTMGDNDLISYSNLTPQTPIIFPVNTQINELTFSNTQNNVECDIEIWEGEAGTGTLVKTVNISTGIGVKSQAVDLNVDVITFTAGEEIQLRYIDQGTNAKDMVIVLWISRIP